jgi:hypothetical protein
MTKRPRPLTMTVLVLDLGAAKRYLNELRSLCDEAIRSSDERLIAVALRIVADQRSNVAELRRRMKLFEFE